MRKLIIVWSELVSMKFITVIVLTFLVSDVYPEDTSEIIVITGKVGNIKYLSDQNVDDGLLTRKGYLYRLTLRNIDVISGDFSEKKIKLKLIVADRKNLIDDERMFLMFDYQNGEANVFWWSYPYMVGCIPNELYKNRVEGTSTSRVFRVKNKRDTSACAIVGPN